MNQGITTNGIIIHCKYDELVNPSSLKNYVRNRNKHPQSQVDRLARQYGHHGIRHPIIVDIDRKIIAAGHGRKLAAIRAGITDFPVVYQKFETDEDLYTFCQSDNALTMESELDLSGINMDLADLGPFDLDKLGIPDFQVDVADKFADKDADEIPDEVEPIAKLGQIYKLGNHRLMCGDSTSKEDVSKLMDGEMADMVFTDPPYGVKVVKSGKVGADFGVAKKGQYKEIINDETTDCAKLFYETSKSLGFKNFILWGANYFTDCLEPKNSWVVWNKRGETSIKNTFADCELAWSDIGFPCRIHSQLWNGMIRSGEKDKRVHPTQKPIKLAEFCFDLLKECKSVYDGFGGSGSTLIACEKTNRKCFMMELDPHYVDVIIARWEKFTGQKAELLNG